MISLLVSFFFFFIGMVMFFVSLFFLMNKYIYMLEWNIISLNSVDIYMLFMFDWMSLLFMSFVLFISSMVLIYSFDYMKEDLSFNRFIMLILLFVFSMLLMIMSPNLISILLGWDGLGLISYCLVAYYQNIKSYNAAMLTVLMNRFGDTGLMMSLSIMYYMGSWNLMLYNWVDFLVIMLVCLAAFTKSAQIPFSSWLPAAMAAPTPISSLVHSSTLVTAGVYLVIRFNDLLMMSGLNELILILSVLTMFMAGVSANWEYDLKKIIALSTLSQLGLMMAILSLGGVKLAYLHLLTHAMFKALLFMCAGVIIHSMKNFQDIRFMGSMVYIMPYTMMCFNVANLSLMGMPFLAGFYSKDLILEQLMFMGESLIIMFLFYISIGLTVSYTLRMFLYSLFMEMKMSSCFSLKDENFYMNFSMIFMLIMSVISGKFLYSLMFFNINFIVLPKMLKLMVLFFSFLGLMIGLFIFYLNFYFCNHLMILKNFFNKMWFLFDLFYNMLGLIFSFSGKLYILNEKMWGEYMYMNILLKMKYFVKNVDYFYINSFKLIMFIYFYVLFVILLFYI
ncbi:NADH dehydrogenase subunit 5 (mitochondrion) [Cephus cinctus]|uniref:NADH-ubiquinone oxidoreductase chain 5 n=1 Tax=Cephus cinctus TaxID=211228 RepID=C4NCD7_CEPCN|nr:NADH dehydrogenase subunit 5 [Cephus cinctus]ACJ69688.1 NADH dehydrogenase subunit 5 [Cephus cinctus]